MANQNPDAPQREENSAAAGTRPSHMGQQGEKQGDDASPAADEALAMKITAKAK
jgi:hypothetical protein